MPRTLRYGTPKSASEIQELRQSLYGQEYRSCPSQDYNARHKNEGGATKGVSGSGVADPRVHPLPPGSGHYAYHGGAGVADPVYRALPSDCGSIRSGESAGSGHGHGRGHGNTPAVGQGHGNASHTGIRPQGKDYGGPRSDQSVSQQSYFYGAPTSQSHKGTGSYHKDSYEKGYTNYSHPASSQVGTSYYDRGSGQGAQSVASTVSAWDDRYIQEPPGLENSFAKPRTTGPASHQRSQHSQSQSGHL
jgi:hypothetical protein